MTTLTPVHSQPSALSIGRFSMTHLVAGLLVTVAAFSVLAAFGLAVTMSVGDKQIGSGFEVWMMLTAVLSLFWGASVMTGSNEEIRPQAAFFQGAAFWAATLTVASFLSYGGLNLGLNAYLGFTGNDTLINAVAQALREFGVDEEQIMLFAEQIRRSAPSPTESWTAFIVLLISLAACISGSLFATQRDESKEVGFRSEEHEHFLGRAHENTI